MTSFDPATAAPAAPAAPSAAGAGARVLPWWLALLAAALAVPFVAQGYVVFQATMVLSYAVALLGLNILTGYNGQISLGHGAFYAIGAYTCAILMDRFGVPYWATLPAAALACLVAGYLFGLPALKLEGLYLALATFALSVAMPQLLKYKYLEPWTGGVQGIVLNKPDAPFGLPLTQDQWLYLFALAVVLLMFVLARNLLDSGAGRAIVAIREHPLAAEGMGIDNRHYKASAFALSAMFTGVGGALSAIAVQFVAPDSFPMFLSISLLVGVVVGGVGTLSGAWYGALFIMFVPSAAEKVSKAAPWAIYGAVLILFVFVLPGGVAGLVRQARARFGAR
ncbi:branched-chain amino acid ABC transporter permease [Cupriavidus sp. USMAHM13]|uniref:branched-chain amino acid ABC transporter permease n=1 Tax=Cupriavidus sp. USMAHM13 TaxID=1389192 RepID=UPI0008A6C13F|nr:branched-chain amino acid ABC transporter permease [Cupriavidus sp. USMAHM13]AOZ03258.1 branched-chain amino acid ABC transporter permease [Cupriavidus sp. USMAHM13]